MFQVKVMVASFKIWGCFSTPKHLVLVYGLVQYETRMKIFRFQSCLTSQFREFQHNCEQFFMLFYEGLQSVEDLIVTIRQVFSVKASPRHSFS